MFVRARTVQKITTYVFDFKIGLGLVLRLAVIGRLEIHFDFEIKIVLGARGKSFFMLFYHLRKNFASKIVAHT
jgi:hypothetical protein